jgi:hypothetical protein
VANSLAWVPIQENSGAGGGEDDGNPIDQHLDKPLNRRRSKRNDHEMVLKAIAILIFRRIVRNFLTCRSLVVLWIALKLSWIALPLMKSIGSAGPAFSLAARFAWGEPWLIVC